MLIKAIKQLFPYKIKRNIKEHLGVPSLHWSLENLRKKNFSPAVVYDIGAYEGLWTKDVMEVYPSARYLMIEAQSGKQPYLEAIKRAHPNVDYSISLLTSTDGETMLFQENETASHVVTKATGSTQYTEVKGVSLDSLVKRINHPLPEFLKLDVQGHELEVLRGAERCLDNATVCLLEISLLDLGENVPLLAEMVAYMDNRGFQAYDISHFIRRPYDKALYQVDMFFAKKDSALIAEKRW